MGFYEFDTKITGGFSKDYFKNRAVDTIRGLSEFNFTYVDLKDACYYSQLYAEARLHEAEQRIDLTLDQDTLAFWRKEEDRWQNALRKMKEGDYSYISYELETDAEKLLLNPFEDVRNPIIGNTLMNLSEILEEDV